MSEDKWEAATDIETMLEIPLVVQHRRKVRLFGAACCRQLGAWLLHPRVLKALDAAERYADGKITDDTLSKWSREAVRARDTCDTRTQRFDFTPEWIAYHAVAYLTTPNRYGGWRMVASNILRREELFRDAIPDLHARLLALLRDIFANPFRPVDFSPSWRTDTAVTLARQMYESREFSAMPILADALQDAGCDNDDILNHCRDATLTHVRGCWVVDLVLGKA
jgi:hypothetical protein